MGLAFSNSSCGDSITAINFALVKIRLLNNELEEAREERQSLRERGNQLCLFLPIPPPKLVMRQNGSHSLWSHYGASKERRARERDKSCCVLTSGGKAGH